MGHMPGHPTVHDELRCGCHCTGLPTQPCLSVSVCCCAGVLWAVERSRSGHQAAQCAGSRQRQAHGRVVSTPRAHHSTCCLPVDTTVCGGSINSSLTAPPIQPASCVALLPICCDCYDMCTVWHLSDLPLPMLSQCHHPCHTRHMQHEGGDHHDPTT